MFDRVDAAVFHPIRMATYFFRRGGYVKYVPGDGVQPLGGSKIRRTGIDGWRTLPEEFRSDLDAALYYPNGHIYFFKGRRYVKYKPGEGIVPTGGGSAIRTIGTTGWTSFPAEFQSDLDAAMYYPSNGHAYFFKGGRYVKYKPGEGVVSAGGSDIRTIGVTGWQDLPASFRDDLDAVYYYPITERAYFFKDRRYVRWTPGDGVDARYPRRLGLRHRKHGGWPGLSSVLGGPIAGSVSADAAVIWLWLAGGRTPADLTIKLDGAVVGSPQWLEPDLGSAASDVLEGVDAVDPGSLVRHLRFDGLASDRAYAVDICRADDGSTIESIAFTTAPPVNAPARVRVALGSCANSTAKASVNTFRGLARTPADLLILCGDNCYYYNATGSSTKRGVPGWPHDWTSVEKMLVRQLEARNHPQFVPLARARPVFSTWDDHDFSYNNCDGHKDADDAAWVGRERAAGVYRLMWNHPYRTDGNHIYYDVRWGPLHIFMTDGRYHSHRNDWILGETQLDRLVSGLVASDAPVKILVVASQLVASSREGFLNAAPDERTRLLDTIAKDVRGRVLVFSGDVHFSECRRVPEDSDAPMLLEVTSSPLRVTKRKKVKAPHVGRLWHTVQQSFAVIDVDVTSVAPDGRVTGTVRIEAFDEDGDILESSGPAGLCRTTWNLDTGALT